MDEALKKACRDIRRLHDHLHKAVEAGDFEAVHCIAKAISASAFDACHAACCCCEGTITKK